MFQVFGIIHLAMFIASPIFGHFLPRLGLRRVFSFGVTFINILHVEESSFPKGSGYGRLCLLFWPLRSGPIHMGFPRLLLCTEVSFSTYHYELSPYIRIVEGVAEAGAW